jgi:ubiquinone/menaquinone biosynthesis C-methylase UbiE
MSVIRKPSQADLIRDRFTQTAQVFGDYAVSYRAKFAETLMRLVSAGPNERVVDLASGPGTLALRFARGVRWVCAVDLTPAMVARARTTAAEEGLKNIAWTIADAQSLPFADGCLDIAVTSYSLHHMLDPARVIREMARVVKRGGRVGIIDIVVPEDPRAQGTANRIEIARDPSHTRSLPKSDFEQMVAAAGLRWLGHEIHPNPRSFDHWLHVAGWHRGDAVYEETRRLMEATLADDLAGFHARLAPADTPRALQSHPPSPADSRPDIQMANTAIFLGAEKI